MKKSLFAFLAVWYSAIAKKLESTVNGKNESEPMKYLHKEMLTEELSTDLKWESSSIDGYVLLSKTNEGTKVSFQGKGSAGYSENSNSEISLLRKDFINHTDSLVQTITIQQNRNFNNL